MNEYEAEDSEGDWDDNSLAQSVFANLDNESKSGIRDPEKLKETTLKQLLEYQTDPKCNDTVESKIYRGCARWYLTYNKATDLEIYGQVNSRRT